MYNHAVTEYICPICLALSGVESSDTMICQSDIFYRDDHVAALINSKFVGNNPGHVIVVPTNHVEHLYDLQDEAAFHIMSLSRQMAIAMKHTRHCAGVTLLQNNEPVGDQHAFHYHQHIFPRFEHDQLHISLVDKVRVSSPEERTKYASELRAYFSHIK